MDSQQWQGSAKDEAVTMNDTETPDLFTGQQLRDAGISQVLNNNVDWIVLCVAEAERFAIDALCFTGEDIRLHCRIKVGQPRHHNAWGALINILIKRKIIVPTGQFKHMRDPTSHARLTPVYQNWKAL